MSETSDIETPAPEESQSVTPVDARVADEVDIAEEAGKAATGQATDPKEHRIRSLEDLELDGEIRSKIESYVSKAINEAVSKHDARQKKKLDSEGYMSRQQIEDLLAAKDAELKQREAARERFLNVLGSEGIAPGSEKYRKIQETYRDAIEEGTLRPEILLSEAGIRTLVAISGVSSRLNAEAAGPRSGLARSQPSPDGSVAFADGTLQLNARKGEDATLEDRMRRAIEASLDQ